MKVRIKGLLFILLLLFSFMGNVNIYAQDNSELSDQEKGLLKHIPKLLFSLPDPLSMDKRKHELKQPMAVDVDEDTGDIYVSDALNFISVFSSEGAFLGKFGGSGSEPGKFNVPVDLFINQEKNLLNILDQRNYRVQVFKLSDDLIKVEEKSSEEQGGSKAKPILIIPLPEGSVAQLGEAALLKVKGNVIRARSSSLASDSFGKIVVLNGGAHRVLIYNEDGEYLTKFGKAGTDSTSFNFPDAIDLAEVEYIDEKKRRKKRVQYYIVDTMNRRVLVITEKGEPVFEIARTAAKKAAFSGPTGIAVDDNANIYVLDRLAGECYMFDEDGDFMLVFGQENDLYEKLYLPIRLKVSSKTKRIYIADMGNNRIMVYQMGSL